MQNYFLRENRIYGECDNMQAPVNKIQLKKINVMLIVEVVQKYSSVFIINFLF